EQIIEVMQVVAPQFGHGLCRPIDTAGRQDPRHVQKGELERIRYGAAAPRHGGDDFQAGAPRGYLHRPAWDRWRWQQTPRERVADLHWPQMPQGMEIEGDQAHRGFYDVPRGANGEASGSPMKIPCEGMATLFQ